MYCALSPYSDFLFIAVQGHKKCLNAIFSNIKMVMHGWPEDFHFRHLKRAVLVNMIEKRKEFMDDSFIVKHLNKSQYSYKDAVLEIKNRDAEEPIPQYLLFLEQHSEIFEDKFKVNLLKCITINAYNLIIIGVGCFTCVP